MRTLIVIDGNSLMYRAFYALPLLKKGEEYTNAVYGFLGMLFRMVKDYAPTHLCVAFDLHGPTFRHTLYPAYKDGRKATPDELRPQFDLLRKLLTEMGITYLQKSPYEADDILGTLSLQAEKNGDTTYLVTGDRDSLQLVDTHTTVLFTKKGLSQVDVMTPESLPVLYGTDALHVPDLKGLMGDASDNLPGVSGVGEKTALKLLQEYTSLENLYAHAEEIKGKLKEKLLLGKDSAFLCKKLATIDRAVPLDKTYEDCAMPPLETAKNLEILKKYGFDSLSRRLEKALKESGETASLPTIEKEENPVTDSREFPFIRVPVWQEEKSLTQEEEIAAFLQAHTDQAVSLHMGKEALYLAFADGARCRVMVKADLLTDGLYLQDALRALTPLWQGKESLLLLDVKTLRHLLPCPLTAPCQDAALMAYLLDSLRTDYSLESLTQAYPAKGENAVALWQLGKELRLLLESNEMTALYTQIELPLEKVLFSMEENGFHLSAETLRRLGQELDAQIHTLAKEIYDLAGENFNILSPKQLGTILFEKLGLPTGRKTQRGYSTDADTLEALSENHPIADKVLEYRTLTKLKSTYIDALPQQMDKNGFIHTTFKQMVTATGRISSTEPNLQNIPIRTQLGREIRKAFIPRDENHILLDADYSQIELRVLAHMSGDPALCEAFRLGQDIHTRTASEIFSVPMEAVTPLLRSRAKAVNFGIVYGISDFGLSRNTGLSRKEARSFIETYFERYPDVRRYMDRCVANGQTQGWAQTLFARRRPLPELSSPNRVRRAFGERVAMNTPIQGTAADIIKIAMVQVYRALQEGGYAAKLILQVHDELLLDCPREEAEEVSALLRSTMENAVTLCVPLEAQVERGETWYESK